MKAPIIIFHQQGPGANVWLGGNKFETFAYSESAVSKYPNAQKMGYQDFMKNARENNLLIYSKKQRAFVLKP